MSAFVRDGSMRERVLGLIAALRPEDLEERLAPIKCSKHPDSPECASDYGIPPYGAPEYGSPEYAAPAYGVPADAGASGADPDGGA
jgi:hypothetical protein